MGEGISAGLSWVKHDSGICGAYFLCNGVSNFAGLAYQSQGFSNKTVDKISGEKADDNISKIYIRF